MIGFLENESINKWARCKLAKACTAQLPSWLSSKTLHHQVIGLLESETIDKWVRVELAKACVAQLPKLSNKNINMIIMSLLKKNAKGSCLFSKDYLSIPAYLLISHYTKMNKKTQSMLINQLLTHHVLLVKPQF